MNKILVTGHKGFIGSKLIPALQETDNVLAGMDRKDDNDILKVREEDFPDVDTVIHLAADPGVIASMKDPYGNARNNILGTIRLLQLYPDAKFIFASSGGTIQPPLESPYGLSKYTCEQYIQMLHSNYVILRFPNVFGPGSRSVVDKWLNTDEPVMYGDGNTYRIYAHVDDVVKGIIQSLEWEENNLYSMGTDQRYSVKEIADAIGKPYKTEPARAGEIQDERSQLPDTTPDWEPEIDVLDYIEEHNVEEA